MGARFDRLYEQFLAAHPHLEEQIATLPRLSCEAEVSLVVEVLVVFGEWYYARPGAKRTARAAKRLGLLLSRRLLAVQRGEG